MLAESPWVAVPAGTEDGEPTSLADFFRKAWVPLWCFPLLMTEDFTAPVLESALWVGESPATSIPFLTAKEQLPTPVSRM